MSESERADPVFVPHRELAPQTLRAMIEEFVTRDGTDYGALERSLEGKVADGHAHRAVGGPDGLVHVVGEGLAAALPVVERQRTQHEG